MNDTQLAKMAEIIEREKMDERQKAFFEKYLRASFRLKKILTKPKTFKAYGVSYGVSLRILENRENLHALTREVFPDFELESRRILFTDDKIKYMLADYANRTGEVPSYNIISRASRDILPSTSSVRKLFGHLRMEEICEQLKEEGLIIREIKSPPKPQPIANPNK